MKKPIEPTKPIGKQIRFLILTLLSSSFHFSLFVFWSKWLKTIKFKSSCPVCLFSVQKISILPENDSWFFHILVTLTKKSKKKMKCTQQMTFCEWEKINHSSHFFTYRFEHNSVKVIWLGTTSKSSQYWVFFSFKVIIHSMK